MPRARSSSKNNSTVNLGFEAKLWLAADKLRSNMDAPEYKHTVLGLIFLKYCNDTAHNYGEEFAEQTLQLIAEFKEDALALYETLRQKHG